MSALKLTLLLGAAMAAMPVAAAAQTPAPPSGQTQTQTQTPPAQPAPQPQEQEEEEPKEEEATAVGDVTVTARRSDIRTSIDSISYSLTDDLQATTGSLADALRNIPSVDVDPQGNVTLRGDGNVTILVDGRPSGVLSGQSRSQALLQLPADRYERIEVMTNPSAAHSPEGSGGVINLITKPTATRAAAQTIGSLRLNLGEDGRWNTGLSGSWQKDRLTLSGDLSYRADPSRNGSVRLREQLDPVTGALVSSTRNVQDTEMDQNGAFGRLGLDYRLTDRTQLTLELRSMAFSGGGDGPSFYETRDASGAVVGAYNRDGRFDYEFESQGVTARVVHRFDAAGHEWSNDLRYDRNSNESDSLSASRFLTPAAPDLFERTQQDMGQTTLGFTSAYVRPTADGGRLRAGYEFNQTRPDQEFIFSRGPTQAGLTVIPGMSNRFEARQTVHALYGVYERPLSEKLSAQAGLRLEQADIRITDLTGGVTADQDYFRAYPTAHLQYQLTDTQTLRASYSRRIQRPQPNQLNPFVIYGDPLNLRSGNPNLEPQETDAIEAMWQMRQGQNFYQATLYYRDTDKAFTEAAIDMGGGVLLYRPENLGSRRDIGLEATAAGRLHPTLRYNVSANVFHQEIDAAGLAGGGRREGTLVSGRGSLNWQPTEKDFLQLSVFWQGESLLAQGRRDAGGMVNLGYRRTLSNRLAFNFTARDLFNTFSFDSAYETPLFRDRTESDVKLRAFYIGLTWSFGQGPRRPEQFDFSAPSAGN